MLLSIVLAVVAVAVVSFTDAEEGYPSEYGHGQFAFHGHYGGIYIQL